MTLATQSLELAAGVAALIAAAALLAACLRLRSPVAFVLAANLLAWGILVAMTLALSPASLVERWTTWTWLVLVLVGAAVCWLATGRPLPSAGRAFGAVREALRDRAVATLAIPSALAVAYAAAVALGTPENEWDALAYHLARAAFWYQAHGVGYIGNAIETRLNVSPPDAEIGLLLTMVLTGSQRFVGIVQLGALLACATAVVGLARRLGLGPRPAVFGGLLLVGLPVVLTQAWTALNDLVVASFLATAAYFLLGGAGVELALAALAVALAVGTKFTGVIALPLLVVLALAAPTTRRKLLGLGTIAAGVAAGAVWYLVNFAETGRLDGGLAASANQNPHSATAVLTTIQRFVFQLLDLSGSVSADWRWNQPGGIGVLYRGVGIGALIVAVVALLRHQRGVAFWTPFIAGLVIATTPSLVTLSFHLLHSIRHPTGRPVMDDPNLNAGATPSWYGPVGVVAVIAGIVVTFREVRRRAVPWLALALSLAPPALALVLAVAIVWDPWRGRFLVFGFVLAAATWGLLLRHRWLAWSLAGLAAVTTTLVLVDSESKPSGLRFPGSTDVTGVWDRPDWWTQSVLLDTDRAIFRTVEQRIPARATLALAPRRDELISPFFGRSLERRVVLVEAGRRVPDGAGWLVAAPAVRPRFCAADWRPLGPAQSGWLVSRRVGSTNCRI
jgi:hypothetical protein